MPSAGWTCLTSRERVSKSRGVGLSGIGAGGVVRGIRLSRKCGRFRGGRAVGGCEASRCRPATIRSRSGCNPRRESPARRPERHTPVFCGARAVDGIGSEGHTWSVRLLPENIPASLLPHRETLTRCIEAMARVRRIRRVILFGSHARGDARPDSDVDLCIVADGAEKQLETASDFRRSMRAVKPHLSFTLVPITPQRLRQKKARDDHFFGMVIEEGVDLATAD